MNVSWNKTLCYCLILLSNLQAPVLGIETWLDTLDILQDTDNIKFDSIILLYEGDQEHSENLSLDKGIYHTIFSNAFQGHIVFRSGDNRNYTLDIQTVINGHMQTLIVVLNLKTCHAIRRALFNLPKDYFRNSAWVLVNPYENKNNKDENRFKRIMNNMVMFDSKIYVINVNKTHVSLQEVYKICSEREVEMQTIQNIGYETNSSFVKENRIEKQNVLETQKSIWDRRNSLMGCNLKIAYVDSFNHITMADSEDEIEHIDSWNVFKSGNITMYAGASNELELIKQLSHDLNFTITWVQAKDNSYGVLDNNTKLWNGIIGLLVRDEADLSNAYLINTKSRSEVVSFSTQFHLATFGLFMARPSSVKPSWTTFLDVFSLTYWFLLISMVACLLLVLLFFFQNGKENTSCTTTTFLGDIAASLLTVLLSLGTYDIFNDRIRQFYSRNSFKILIFVICFFGWLIKEVYIGGLISSLIDQRHESKINKLEDILTNPGYQLILRKGTASVQYFENSETWTHKQIWESQLKNNTIAYVDRIMDAETLLLKEEKIVYFELLSQVERIFESYPCKIFKSDNTYFHRPIALAFKKKSPFLALFNHQLRRYKETGIIANMVSLKENPNGVVTCPSYENISIGYEAVFSAFFALTMGLMISVLYLVYELAYEKYFISVHGIYMVYTWYIYGSDRYAQY